MFGITVPDAFAETWYYYVEPLPEYASYANNVMELSTTAWEDVNDDLQFIEVNSPQQANFQVQWVKEFGVEHVGYAYGSWFIEVGLGDSGCGDGIWQPYSEKYVTDIMTHEIGHVLGFDHVNDPNSIMYPTAINWEYGNVETKKTLTNGYGYFQPICTSKDVTTFDWYVSSDDPTYGFDVYFVPSVNEFDNWINGDSFNYFDDNGCFAENMLSVGGTCEGVTQDSGLLIIMGDDSSEPLTDITFNLQENNSESTIDTSNSEKSFPNSNSDNIIQVDNTFALYVDPQQQFSIKYPSNWIISSENNGMLKVNFINDYDWEAQIYIIDYGDVDYSGMSESEILNDIVSYEQERCNDASIIDTGYICYDFELAGSERFLMPSGEEVYLIGYTDTRQYDPISEIEYPISTILTEIHNDSNVWVAYAEFDTYVGELYGEVLWDSLGSFKIIQSGEDSSTTQSIPIPIPTPQPEVITSTGTATLSKTSVDLSANQSEQVKIYGIINNVDKSTRVSITYTYPDGTTDGGTIFTTDTGVYETYLNLDNNSPTGVYEILVTAKGKIIGSLNLQVNDKKLESHPFVEIKTTSEIVPEVASEVASEPTPEPTLQIPASFVDQTKDPQSYIDRYYNEPKYKQWFDSNYSQYSSIYEAVGWDYLQDLIDKLPEGVLILSIIKNSGAEQAGLLAGDIIIAINGEKTIFDWNGEGLPDLTPKETVRVSILRDGQPLEFELKVMPAPYDPERGLIGVMREGTPSSLIDMEMERKSINEKIKSFSEIKLLEGQWVEYDFKIEFEGEGSEAKIVENILFEGLQESNFNPFDMSKLRIEVIKITDYTVILKYVITLQDNTEYEKYSVIHPNTIPDMFNSVFIEIPAPKEIIIDENSSLFFIDTMFKGEENIMLKKMNIPTFLYTGYKTENNEGIISSFNSEMNFEKDSGILLKSDRRMVTVGSNEYFGKLSYEIYMEQSVTDYYIPNQNKLDGMESSPVIMDAEPSCGRGTSEKDGICVVNTSAQTESSQRGGGCLIATATYGSEMALEVQQLRELRDNQLMNTESGTAFMGTFNDIYYSFSPIIADYERENPLFKEAVKLAITPMISTLSLMESAETESEVLSIGISVIMLNLGMYLGVPAIAIIGIKRKF